MINSQEILELLAEDPERRFNLKSHIGCPAFTLAYAKHGQCSSGYSEIYKGGDVIDTICEEYVSFLSLLLERDWDTKKRRVTYFQKKWADLLELHKYLWSSEELHILFTEFLNWSKK